MPHDLTIEGSEKAGYAASSLRVNVSATIQLPVVDNYAAWGTATRT